MKCQFVPIVREGWLQYRKEPKILLKSWKVGWFELLADGKLSWFPSPSKQPNESRYIVCSDLTPFFMAGLVLLHATERCHMESWSSLKLCL